MGIRFQCPNGHKLHVKNHLAGQHGFCPECNVRVQIPTPRPHQDDTLAGRMHAGPSLADSSAAQAAPAKPAEQPAQASAPPAAPTTPNEPNRGESILAPPTQPFEPQPAPPPSPDPKPAEPPSTGAAPAGPKPRAIPKAIPKARPIAPAAPLAPETAPGPAATSAPTETGAPVAPPASVPPPPPPPVEWRLQTSLGEQFGPADAGGLARWQAEGRLTDDAYVWRTGWAEWRTVADARAELPPAAVGFPLAAPAPAAEPKAESPASKYVEKRRRAARRQVYVAVILLVLVLVMGVAIAVVLRRPAAPADPLPPATPADPAEDQQPNDPQPDAMGEADMEEAAMEDQPANEEQMTAAHGMQDGA